MSPTDDYLCLPQIAQIHTDYFHADHSLFTRRTNQFSPLQGELEGVGNMAHPENGVIEYLNVL